MDLCYGLISIRQEVTKCDSRILIVILGMVPTAILKGFDLLGCA